MIDCGIISLPIYLRAYQRYGSAISFLSFACCSRQLQFLFSFEKENRKKDYKKIHRMMGMLALIILLLLLYYGMDHLVDWLIG